MNIKLTERLKMVADMVRPGYHITDIGTDHAYLPTYLVLEGIIPSATASDIKKGPLDNARTTVTKYNLEDKIELKLSDGFDNIVPQSSQDIIICGMGGTLISEILSCVEWIKDKNIRLIIQPMTHAEDVRKFLCENGFEIIKESAVMEDERLYIAMCAKYTAQNKIYEESYYYFGKLKECDNIYAKEYIRKQTARLKQKADALEKSGQQIKEAKRIRRILFGMEENQ